MGQKSTIESLISTSGEDDLEGLPLFYEGKIVKRISKEEIQGWSQGHHGQPFHKKQIESRKRHLFVSHKKSKGLSEKFEEQEWTSAPTLDMIKKQLKQYGETKDLFPAFKTFSQLPQIAEDTLPSKAKSLREPKQDFIKGIRFQNCPPIHRKTTTLKPLTKPPAINCQKTIRVRSRSVSTNKSLNKRPSTQNKVSIISYPLDIAPDEESDCQLTQNKLHSYMRKYQI